MISWSPSAGLRTNATLPSDAIVGSSSCSALVTYARSFEPSASISQTSPLRRKTIVLPSGESSGSRSIAVLFVRRVTSPPPVSIE
jgi:hypothetical protein